MPIKLDVKDYLEADEVDLSLQSLTGSTVPVKELALLKKGKKLDLSKNQISILPESFISLTHLVKLDLSGNGLTELPNNIGILSLLQHLDLFNNEIVELPITLHQMKLLKWLDVKENPLNFPPNSVTGLCRNDVECKKCAMQVIDFLKKENSDRERMRQKELEEKRARKELQKREQDKLEEEEERERKRIKTQEKAKRAAQRRREFEEREKTKPKHEEPVKVIKKEKGVLFSKSETKGSARTVIFYIAFTLLIIGLCLLTLDPTISKYIKHVTDNMKIVFDSSLKSVAFLVTKIENAITPLVMQLDRYMHTHLPLVQYSIHSAKDTMSELVVVCRDTIYLGMDLAKEELSYVMKQIKM